MKQIIPFTKDITFKTSINELVSISLDHDLKVEENSLIKGNFYLKGSYKILKSNIETEKFSYKIPCEIDIAGNYDIKDATIDIDDFNYDIDNDTLKIDVKLLIDNLKAIELKEKELVREEKNDPIDKAKEEIKEYILDNIEEDDKEVENLDTGSLKEDYSNMFNLSSDDETYLTYYVYTYQENDTVESILNKYSITKYDLEEYNDLDDLKTGSKLIIPTKNAWSKRTFKQI